jgi:hypothetical protein
MADIVSFDAKKAERLKRWEARAAAIIQEIDPQAGGFFRRCLERAALKGMEFAADESTADASTKTE